MLFRSFQISPVPVDQANNGIKGRDLSITLTAEEIMTAVHTGTAERVRPIAMTATAIIAGLLPIMWGSGTGSAVMQRIASPMVGGMVTVTLLSLLVLPVIYGLVLQVQERFGRGHISQEATSQNGLRDVLLDKM